MVLDTFKYKESYLSMNSRFITAFRFIEQCILHSPVAGRYELDGEKVYAMVQEYTTKPSQEVQWESHRRYIDIQFILSGQEIIESANISKMPEGTLYNSEKDYYKCSGVEGSPLLLNTNSFAIFFPQDMHKACVMAGEPAPVKKIVIKVAI